MRVLVIEDDARVAAFLDRGLRAEGYRVEVCRDGEAGLVTARALHRACREANSPAVIVMDVMMPGRTGLALCQTLRAEGLTLPVLMLTALGNVDERVQGLRSGADDYLAKPFAFEELLARIEALMRRPVQWAAPNQVVAVGDLVLQRDTMRVTRDGQPLTLTARELAVLELLMASPGRLFSRERILASVWGSHEDPLTNVVDVYIRRLRVKIDGGRAQSLIQTVRGLGYRLEAPGDAPG